MYQQQLQSEILKYNLYNSIKKYQVPRTKAIQDLSMVHYKTLLSKNSKSGDIISYHVQRSKGIMYLRYKSLPNLSTDLKQPQSKSQQEFCT